MSTAFEPAPVLIEVTRGRLVECVHRGVVAVARSDGTLLAGLGATGRRVFPRSAIKALQCLPLIESGAADRFGFADAEIAIACASHSGSQRHCELARSMLERAGLGPDDLGCGAHVPLGEAEAREFHRRAQPHSPLYNNCSGKHAGMLATAVHLGEPTGGYWLPENPVQKRVRAVLETFCGGPLAADAMGIDGCRLPTWALTMERMAAAFAAFGAGEGAARPHRDAIRRILGACWAEPEMVAGAGRFDTLVLRRLAGKVFLKTGAEGVYCGALPSLGLGFAVKIDDGATRASEAVVRALLARLLPGAADLGGDLAIANWQGDAVGALRPAGALLRALDAIGAAD